MSENNSYQVIESAYSVSGRILIVLECPTVIPTLGTILTGKAGYSWEIDNIPPVDEKILAKIPGKAYHFFRVISTDGILRKPVVGELLTSNC